jgi:HAD superfamily hydrolase (TIGR01509 family)
MSIVSGKLFHQIPTLVNIRVVIFDLDGVICDTASMHRDAFVDAYKVIYGKDVSDSDVISVSNSESTYEKFKKLRGDNAGYDKFITLKDSIFVTTVTNRLVPVNEVYSVLSLLRDLGIKTAIASNSRKSNIDLVLRKLGIHTMFDTVVSGYDVARPKPYPDIIWKVFEDLQIAREDMYRTVFLDDTDIGLAAGDQSPAYSIRINSVSDLTVDFIKQIGVKK